MKSAELNNIFNTAYPELKSEYEEEVCWQEGDDTGSHVVFGDVFTPYIERLLNDRDEVKTEKAFSFIEKILDMNDRYCDEVIAFSVLEKLMDDLESIESVKKIMGEKTQKICKELRQSFSR